MKDMYAYEEGLAEAARRAAADRVGKDMAFATKLLVKSTLALDLFGPGRYTLET